MQTVLLVGEEIIKEGSANLQRGLETAGGNLFITNKRIIFEPHLLNVQRKIEIIDLAQIVQVSKAWTKFLNFIPLMPNSLSVKTGGGNNFKFVLFKRGDWISAIENLTKRG